MLISQTQRSEEERSTHSSAPQAMSHTHHSGRQVKPDKLQLTHIYTHEFTHSLTHLLIFNQKPAPHARKHTLFALPTSHQPPITNQHVT